MQLQLITSVSGTKKHVIGNIYEQPGIDILRNQKKTVPRAGGWDINIHSRSSEKKQKIYFSKYLCISGRKKYFFNVGNIHDYSFIKKNLCHLRCQKDKNLRIKRREKNIGQWKLQLTSNINFRFKNKLLILHYKYSENENISLNVH